MIYEEQESKPILSYSDTLERATLIDNDYQTESMPAKKGRSNKKSGVRKQNKSKKKKVRVNKGRINLKVAGYQGLQSVSASELVHYIALSKLRAAAKKLLKKHGNQPKKIKRKKPKK